VVYESMHRILILSQKMGLSKNHFCNLEVSLPRGWKYFCEYLPENKNIFGCDSRDNVLLIHKKPYIKDRMQVSL